MKVVSVIGARLNSSRLPGKHLLPLAGKPLIERLLERLKCCKCIDQNILATTADDFNQPLIEWAKGKVDCYAHQGDVNDLMARVDAVVAHSNPDIIVYICGDSPLISPEFIDHAVAALMASAKKSKPADTIAVKPTIQSIHEGMIFYSRAGWDKLMQNSSTKMQREHVGHAAKQKPILEVEFIDDCADYSFVKHRISVDTRADYEFMSLLYSRWYEQNTASSIVSLGWVQQQLINEPQLVSINQHVVQKQPEKQYEKISLFCHSSKDTGLGHLRRCALIAESLQENFGFGTEIHNAGIQQQYPWLNSNVIWYNKQEDCLKSMEHNQTAVWIIDFHPDHIDTDTLIKNCSSIKKRSNTTIIALDKMSALLEVADQLFIPSFYTELESTKVSVGWQNYLLTTMAKLPKKKQCIVLTGGSDTLGFGKFLPNLLEQNIPDDWDIIWIQGPYADKPLLTVNSQRWHLYNNPDDLQNMIASSELILSCYGLSMFEALASDAMTLMLPSERLCSRKELDAFETQQCCFIARNNNEIVPKLHHLFADTEQADKFRTKARTLLSVCNGYQELGNSIVKLL